MLSDIIVGVICVLIVAAGIFGWWMENGGRDRSAEDKNTSEDTSVSSKGMKERKKEDEKD